MNMRLHAFEPASRSNGPGLRAVVWFQGCTLACPGCFNPDAHDPEGGQTCDTEDLTRQILEAKQTVEGVSISGGEPFQQPEALLDLLQRMKECGLSRLVFTGFTLDEAKALPLGPQILACVDILVAGRYVRSRHVGQGLIGSSNQRIHCLTTRYRPSDFVGIPASEIILHRDGSITLTGVSPRRMGH
ncbi:MAG TPA: 4Fe-4S single cluster domain-containing protein [Candidatus Hydrogenedentes bacterium]|nr:4Fe-4S single cluster domain-containing protein [Candidatus Hydrogenedentota bacterium]